MDISEGGGTSGNNSRVNKDRANRKMKTKTRTWSDVVKGLKIEDKLETYKSRNESDATDSANSLIWRSRIT